MDKSNLLLKADRSSMRESDQQVGKARPQLNGKPPIDPAENLTHEEQKQLARSEAIIAKGWHTFVEVGRELSKIRDRRLYRAKYKTFETYIRERWQFSRAKAYYLIGAAEVMEILSTIVDISLPNHESQVRPLIGLDSRQTQKAWRKALELAQEGPVTAKVVAQAAEAYRRKDAPKKVRAKRVPKHSECWGLLKAAMELRSLVEQKEEFGPLLERVKALEELVQELCGRARV